MTEPKKGPSTAIKAVATVSVVAVLYGFQWVIYGAVVLKTLPVWLVWAYMVAWFSICFVIASVYKKKYDKKGLKNVE